MAVPEQAITVTPQQIEQLHQKLAKMRHNVNNNLSLVVAALELIRRKPEMAERLLDNISQQPEKIITELKAFSEEFEKALNISR
jgi:hypothetical protein